ncbi:MAG: prepilin-type N-terminal cleavage/methylation domain-containing protein [Pseudomonadota bacterium]
MKKKGFTLVELMIVVAIIAILAAIAIPSFMAYIKKSKKSEVGMLINGIFAAEADYNINNAKFHKCYPAVPTSDANVLNGNRIKGSRNDFINNTSGFAIIGFAPDQDTYSGAMVECEAGPLDPTIECVMGIYQDLDDDDSREEWYQAFKRDKTGTQDAYKDGGIEGSPDY